MNCTVITIAAALLLTGLARAGEITVEVDGKPVKLQCLSINHAIKTSDQDHGSQTSAMACSFLSYSLLAKQDIPGAARLSTDPAETAEKWTKYRERIGADDFRKMMGNYFTSKNVVLAELVLGDDTMLVVKSEEYTAAQFFRKQDGKYLVSEKPSPETSGAFSQALQLIQEGKLKL